MCIFFQHFYTSTLPITALPFAALAHAPQILPCLYCVTHRVKARSCFAPSATPCMHTSCCLMSLPLSTHTNPTPHHASKLSTIIIRALSSVLFVTRVASSSSSSFVYVCVGASRTRLHGRELATVHCSRVEPCIRCSSDRPAFVRRACVSVHRPVCVCVFHTPPIPVCLCVCV